MADGINSDDLPQSYISELLEAREVAKSEIMTMEEAFAEMEVEALAKLGLEHGGSSGFGCLFPSDFSEFYKLCLPGLRKYLNKDELRNLQTQFRLYQSRKHGQWRAIQNHPEEFQDFMRKVRRAFYKGGIFDANVFVRMINQFAQKEISGRTISFHHSGLMRRDPRWHAFLFVLSAALSSGMIHNFKSGSVISEIVQSITIGSAFVGSCASLACLSMLYQPWSSRIGFEREVWTERMENVATVATSSTFIVSMFLLLPNNLSRCIVGGVLFAVVISILIFAKWRPKREAETDSVGNLLPTDSASDPLRETASEVISNLLPPDSEMESGDSIV